MRRNLVLLNLLLMALIGMVGWRSWTGYEEALRRQKLFLAQTVPVPPAPMVVIPPPPGQVSAANYYEIAAKLPFSRDRNPVVVVDVVAPPPMPALPRYYGMMNFGGAPKVIMATTPGGPQKSYVAGEKIGDFKLTTIAAGGLIFDWNGKEVAARFDEMRDVTPPDQKQQQPQGSMPPAAGSGGVKSVSSVSTVASGSEKGPGTVDVGDGMKGCQAGDNTPAGTVVGGYRKVMTQTPFGASCRWDKVN